MDMKDLDALVEARRNYHQRCGEYKQMKKLHSVNLFFDGYSSRCVADGQVFDAVQATLISISRAKVSDAIAVLEQLGCVIDEDQVARDMDVTS